MAARHPVLDIIRQHKRGKAVGIYSICSANPFVLRAAMLQAVRDKSAVCIESTSNQVDQFGGYTGMTPPMFAKMVFDIAKSVGLPRDRVILGGDHLGPNAWRNEPAASAMAKSEDLIRSYVQAGFTKIHLDASMPCADDSDGGREHLPDEVVAERAARLCEIAEKTAAKRRGNAPLPIYVVGTEVPRPGGALENLEGLQVTSAKDARRTIAVTQQAFAARKLQQAWQRVVAVVVQPGVEFSDATVVDYDRKKARGLSRFIANDKRLVYEAHSTDYQRPDRLAELVEDHFAILKVGPELTFAFREAVFAMEMMEKEYLGRRSGITLSDLSATLERVMLAKPANWIKHYHGSEQETAFARKYSYSDRSRYYWPDPDVQQALARLLDNLRAHRVPLNLLSQYMPDQYQAVRTGRITTAPEDLIHHRIMQVTDKYARACGLARSTT